MANANHTCSVTSPLSAMRGLSCHGVPACHADLPSTISAPRFLADKRLSDVDFGLEGPSGKCQDLLSL